MSQPRQLQKNKAVLAQVSAALHHHLMAAKADNIGIALTNKFKSVEAQVKAAHMCSTPWQLWRKDKPQLDKRRFKRYQRKQAKAGAVIPLNLKLA